LLKEAIWTHHLHESSDAVLPSIVAPPVDPECRHNHKEVAALLRKKDRAYSDDECLHKFKHTLVLSLETSGKEVAHMNNDALLGRQVVLEAVLASSRVLDFFA